MAATNAREAQQQLPNETSNDNEDESLDAIASWIVSIPPAHVAVLQHMREYRDLQRAFRGLQREQAKLLAWRENLMSDDNSSSNNNNDDLTELAAMIPTFSFLQFMANDDILLRILDFLECKTLCRVMQTCCRFRDLVVRNARRRTASIGRERQLGNVLQLLRAKEHIQGTAMTGNDGHPFVRIPTLLLSRCVRVSDSGDAEYNGIYCCTGSNGNGFVFTKPREPFQRVPVAQRRRIGMSAQQSTGDPDMADPDVSRISQHFENDDDDDDNDESSRSDHLLRCIIAKRFSNETLLWYFSKEVIATEDHGDVRAGEVTQRYSFWSRLSQLGDASPDLCRYPSQTSILRRNGDGWQPLTTTRDTQPPTVELL